MQNIVESNVLIAKFMGAVKIGEDLIAYPDTKIDGGGYISNNRSKKDLHYHSDWNWLMLVVDMIENINHIFEPDNSTNVTIGSTNYCIIQDNLGLEPEFIGQGKTKLESVYIAVVAYIKWLKTKQ